MNKKQNRGITLVALVITIIVLIILAGVSINAVMNGGLIQNAKDAKSDYEKSKVKEDRYLGKLEQEIENAKGRWKEAGLAEDGTPQVSADFYIKSVPAVYAGTPGDAVLVWKQGKPIPKATPSMEEMMEGRSWSLFSNVHTIDWDEYDAYLEQTLGDEMFRKEGIP